MKAAKTHVKDVKYNLHWDTRKLCPTEPIQANLTSYKTCTLNKKSTPHIREEKEFDTELLYRAQDRRGPA